MSCVIAINGVNSHTGGGKSILQNYLTLLDAATLDEQYCLLTARPAEYSWLANSRITIVPVGVGLPSSLTPLLYEHTIGRVLDALRADVVFNLGDLVVNTRVPQVYLFDWSYLTADESRIWSLMSPIDRAQRLFKLMMIKRRICLPSLILAQTPSIAGVLRARFKVQNIEVVPNAVALDNMGRGSGHDFVLPKGFKLLYLTHYYPHKNLEILLPLATLMRQRGLDNRLVITIAAEQNAAAARLLGALRSQRLNDTIVNVGPVAIRDVPDLYRQCDALLMPSLLESFSGTYVEAMYHRLPILTSDRPFARDVCGNAASYFDPNDAADILAKVERLSTDPVWRETLVTRGTARLKTMASWPEVFTAVQQLLKQETTNTSASKTRSPIGNLWFGG